MYNIIRRAIHVLRCIRLLKYLVKLTKTEAMKGIQFLVDDRGEKRSVLIDLDQWGDLWEDFYDAIVCQDRQDEEEISWQDLKQELASQDE